MSINANLPERRSLFLSTRGRPNADSRRAFTQMHDEWLRELATASGVDQHKIAIVAVGGYGRSELCAGSDLDVLVLHASSENPADVKRIADSIFYSIWDSGVALDHSVRDIAYARKMASDDLKVALGLIDARCIAGDEQLVDEVRGQVLADWRALAKQRLPELRELTQVRRSKHGELAHLLEPDLKESFGGLRDITILRGIAATWLTDINHSVLDEANAILLDIRDGLHHLTSTSNDRLNLQDQEAVAQLLGFESDDDLLRAVYSCGRSIALQAESVWRRIDRMTQRRSIVKKIGGISRPDRTPLAHGVVVMDGEVVLAKDAVTETDSTLFLRLAAAAAQSGLPISDSTIAHFKSHFTSHQIEWNAENRDSLISLLGSGNALTPVWAALDEAGLFDKLFVHWRHIRATPQRNALHVFTVDRHSIETAVNAAKFTRNVRRPDLLLIAALFHDIGKGMPGDHSEVGVPLIEENAAALGYSSTDIGVLKKLVRHHLLLAEYATRRDLDDVATITEVADKVQSQEVLELLHYLTIADSQSAAPSVWNEWKNRLLAELVAKTSAVLAGEEIPESASIIGEFPTGISDALVLIESSGTNVQLKVATEDHVGLLSAIAGVLSLERLQVRSANFDTHNNTAYQVWNLVTQFGDAPDVKWLSQQIRHAAENFDWVQNRISGLLPLQSRNRGLIHPGPQARFLTATSQRASILEVRAHDEPALLYRATSPIAHLGFSVVNAHVETLGSEVIDVLYLQTQAGETLTEAQCQQVVTAVLSALSASEAE